MVNLIRKYQQPVLIGITILVIVTFIWFWNGSQAGRAGLAGATTVAKIYGQSITDAEIKKDVSKFEIARALGLNDLIRALAGAAENEQQALENFVFNSYVLNHESDALQIVPSDAEVEEELEHVPGLQTDGRLDPKKLQDFVHNVLPSRGFSDAVIDELVREQVKVKKIKGLIGSTLEVTPAELKNRYAEENEKMELQVVRVNASDLEKAIAVTDADAQKEYDAHKDAYRSDEKRQVSVASFELTDAQKALKGKERTDALQKLGNTAWDFAKAVVDKNADFAAQAKNSGVQVSLTAPFTANEPDPALGKIPTLAATAFKLSPDYPSSDVVEGQNGYYVLHLEKTEPSKQLSFAEAKAKVTEDIRKNRSAQLMQTTATQLHNQILLLMKTGKTFAEAAKSLGQTAETVPPFSLLEASKMDVPDSQSIIQAAVGLGSKQLSDFVQTATGGLMVYMNSRQAPDDNAALIGSFVMKSQYSQVKEMMAFVEWMRLRKAAAKLQIGPR